jgi:hypothetical protein
MAGGSDTNLNNQHTSYTFARIALAKNSSTVAGETEWKASSTFTQTPC